MLASTVQFSSYGHTTRTPRPPTPPPGRMTRSGSVGRYGLRGWPVKRSNQKVRSLRTQQCARPALPQQLTFLAQLSPRRTRLPPAHRRPLGRCSTLERPPHHERVSNDLNTHAIRRRAGRCMLLRKEVIQPHLPVRLPCYDFVPIASPTFDDSLRKRLGHRLRVLPTFVT